MTLPLPDEPKVKAAYVAWKNAQGSEKRTARTRYIRLLQKALKKAERGKGIWGKRQHD